MVEIGVAMLTGSTVSHFGANMFKEIDKMLAEQNLVFASKSEAHGSMTIRFVETTDAGNQPMYQITTAKDTNLPEGAVQEATIHFKKKG
ncbi:MAG: hypothetical protein ABIE94_05755 [archaeon]